MIWRNWLSALIGVWFIGHEWVLHGTPNQTVAFWISLMVGIVQVIASVWAVRELSRTMWQNWVSFACGFYFLIEPFTEHYEEGAYWGIVAPAIVTIGLNLWTIMANGPSARGTRS